MAKIENKVSIFTHPKKMDEQGLEVTIDDPYCEEGERQLAEQVELMGDFFINSVWNQRIKYIFCGDGVRFEMLCDKMCEKLVEKSKITIGVDLHIIYATYLGSQASRSINSKTGEKTFRSSAGKIHPLSQHSPLSDLVTPQCAWDYLKHKKQEFYPYDVIFITGKGFLDCFQFPHETTSGSVYEVDFYNQRLKCFMDNGKINIPNY